MRWRPNMILAGSSCTKDAPLRTSVSASRDDEAFAAPSLCVVDFYDMVAPIFSGFARWSSPNP